MDVTRHKPKVKRAPKSAIRVARKRTQIELREKNFADEALNSLPGLYYLIDDQGWFLLWNKNLEMVSGYSSEEISRLSPTDFFDEPEKEIIAERIRQVFQTGEATVEADFVAKDRTRTPYFFTGKRVQIDGKPCLSGMGIDISERRGVEATLRESEEKLRAIVDGALDGILVAELENRKFLTGNPAICRMLGYTPDEIPRIGVSDIHHKQDLPRVIEQFERQLHGESEMAVDIPVMRKDGSIFFADIKASRIRLGGREGLLGIFRDVTERKQAEARVTHLANIRDALSAVNRAIVHAVSEKSLFKEICRIAVERAGFTLALITLADDKTGTALPVAWTGEPKDFVPKLNLSFSDMPEEHRPIVTAIREQRTIVHQDICALPAEAWSEMTCVVGLRSVAAIPIRKGGKVEGAIAVYSSSAGFFDAETLDLLEEMAEDVSFSLDMLVRERELVDSEHRFRAVLEQSIAGIYVIQDGRIVYFNPRMREIFGYKPDDAIDPDPFAFVAESNRATVAEQMQHRLTDRPTAQYAITALRRDGTSFTLGVNSRQATYDGRPAIIAVAQDITEKAHAEEEIKRYITRLQRAVESTINVVSTIGEIRDPYTHGHEHRVGEIAASIAAAMGWDADRVEGIRVAGYMHDVGKISVPAEILAKPARLSTTEFALVKEHAQQSYEILKGVEFPWPVAEAAWQHHERMDGSGYPRGLKGDEIIPEARIMAVADVIEAMSSHRPYRPGLGVEAALAEIERGRARLYDAQVADACLRMFREKGYTLPV